MSFFTLPLACVREQSSGMDLVRRLSEEPRLTLSNAGGREVRISQLLRDIYRGAYGVDWPAVPAHQVPSEEIDRQATAAPKLEIGIAAAMIENGLLELCEEVIVQGTDRPTNQFHEYGGVAWAVYFAATSVIYDMGPDWKTRQIEYPHPRLAAPLKVWAGDLLRIHRSMPPRAIMEPETRPTRVADVWLLRSILRLLDADPDFQETARTLRKARPRKLGDEPLLASAEHLGGGARSLIIAFVTRFITQVEVEYGETEARRDWLARATNALRRFLVEVAMARSDVPWDDVERLLQPYFQLSVELAAKRRHYDSRLPEREFGVQLLYCMATDPGFDGVPRVPGAMDWARKAMVLFTASSVEADGAAAIVDALLERQADVVYRQPDRVPDELARYDAQSRLHWMVADPAAPPPRDFKYGIDLLFETLLLIRAIEWAAGSKGNFVLRDGPFDARGIAADPFIRRALRSHRTNINYASPWPQLYPAAFGPAALVSWLGSGIAVDAIRVLAKEAPDRNIDPTTLYATNVIAGIVNAARGVSVWAPPPYAGVPDRGAANLPSEVYDSGAVADMTLVFKTGEELRLVRGIMVAANFYWQAQLLGAFRKYDRQDATRLLWQDEKLGYKVVREYCRYVHTGKCTLSADIADDLVSLAHMTEMYNLVEYCAWYMMSNPREFKWARLVRLAREYDLPVLEGVAIHAMIASTPNLDSSVVYAELVDAGVLFDGQ